MTSNDQTTKRNVSQFNEDVLKTGSYEYTTERLSAQLANARISTVIANSFDFSDKTILDLGCGDGTYTLEFPSLGIKKIIGLDPAEVAIEAATARVQKLGISEKVQFKVGNIYSLKHFLDNSPIDCIIIRGVLHHLPDPAKAIAELSSFNGTIIVLEPNGLNPVLKLLEKFSHYHIEHEERSFRPNLICSWLTSAGFNISSQQVINLVPFFCPDWMAKTLKTIEPLFENIPVIRNFVCGQSIIVAQKPS